MDPTFAPTRAAGLARLAAFAPRSGRAYAERRNTDRGPQAPSAVSMLSPYLRRRLVLEQEAVAAALDQHAEGAGKYVDEVFWRTYWKGHLEQHPSLWTLYRAEVEQGWNRLATESGLRRVFEDATNGRTGIDGFDDWARALVSDNWLHNHPRMWFASIWIFTLRLPWALGADFFARHLLDGDPASNTLSWRWVAGLHTRGKHYVARAENVARYTEGRFDVRGKLDEAPEALAEDFSAPAVALPPAGAAPDGPVALLLHDDDLCPETLPLGAARVRAVAGFSAVCAMARNGVAGPVAAFADGALADALDRAARAFGCPATRIEPANTPDWVAGAGLPVLTPYASVGPAADLMAGLPVQRLRRAWDEAAWPHTRRGFFQLRSRIRTSSPPWREGGSHRAGLVGHVVVDGDLAALDVLGGLHHARLLLGRHQRCVLVVEGQSHPVLGQTQDGDAGLP